MTTIVKFDGRTIRKQRGRDQMLYAGLQMVQRGYWRPTVKEIVELSGISIRTFYANFGTVEGFYEALLLRHETSLRACLPANGSEIVRVAITGSPEL